MPNGPKPAKHLRDRRDEIDVVRGNERDDGARAEDEHQRDHRRCDHNRPSDRTPGDLVSPARMATYSKPPSAPNPILPRMLRL